MNREETKQYLSSYLELKREIDILTGDYHFWEETSKSIPVTNWENLGIHGNGRKEPLLKHLDICQTIAFKIDEANKKLNEILTVIDNVSVSDYRSVLRYRYIDGLYFYEIAKKMKFSLDHTYRMHLLALDDVKVDKK